MTFPSPPPPPPKHFLTGSSAWLACSSICGRFLQARGGWKRGGGGGGGGGGQCSLQHPLVHTASCRGWVLRILRDKGVHTELLTTKK